MSKNKNLLERKRQLDEQSRLKTIKRRAQKKFARKTKQAQRRMK